MAETTIGVTKEQKKTIRELQGVLQQETVDTNISLRGAVMWAVKNELEKHE